MDDQLFFQCVCRKAREERELFCVVNYGSLNILLLSLKLLLLRLKQFDRISRRIIQNDLRAAGPGCNVISEMDAGLA